MGLTMTLNAELQELQRIRLALAFTWHQLRICYGASNYPSVSAYILGNHYFIDQLKKVEQHDA